MNVPLVFLTLLLKLVLMNVVKVCGQILPITHAKNVLPNAQNAKMDLVSIARRVKEATWKLKMESAFA